MASARGSLLTCYENPADAPGGEPFVRSTYRIDLSARRPGPVDRPVSAFAAADTGARPGTQLRVYTSMATWCPSCAKHLPLQKSIATEMAAEPVELIAVPIDDADDAAKLKTYVEEKQTPYRLLSTLAAAQRAAFTAELEKLLGHAPGLPSSLVTDASGRVIKAVSGVPAISELRQWLAEEGN